MLMLAGVGEGSISNMFKLCYGLKRLFELVEN